MADDQSRSTSADSDSSDPAPVGSDPTSSGGGRSDAATRGRLDIAVRVVERIATLASLEVQGVVSVGSSLDGVIGRRYPKADAEVAGGRTRVKVEVAVAWPQPLAQVTGQVRDTVRARLFDLAGLVVDAVDVTAAKVVHPEQTEERRVQ